MFIHIMSTILSSESEHSICVGLGHEGNLTSVKITAHTWENTAAFRSDSLSNVLFIWLRVGAKCLGLRSIPLLPLERGPDMCGTRNLMVLDGGKLINRSLGGAEGDFTWPAVWPESGPSWSLLRGDGGEQFSNVWIQELGWNQNSCPGEQINIGFENNKSVKTFYSHTQITRVCLKPRLMTPSSHVCDCNGGCDLLSVLFVQGKVVFLLWNYLLFLNRINTWTNPPK